MDLFPWASERVWNTIVRRLAGFRNGGEREGGVDGNARQGKYFAQESISYAGRIVLGAVKHSALGFLAFHPAYLFKAIPCHFHGGAPGRGQTEQKSLIKVPGTNRANVSLMIQLQVTKKLEQMPQVLYVFGKVSGKLCAEVRSTDGGREVLEGRKATRPWTKSKKPPKPQSNKQKELKRQTLEETDF